jgi:RNA polymerase sigma factor (sigma-70 family)
MGSETAVEALRRSSREPEAFVGFYDWHAQRLLAYFARRVYDADVALELTAESFAQAYIGRRRFRGSTDGAAAAWLYTIARRQLSRYFRTATVRRKALERLGLEAPLVDGAQRARIDELAGLDDLRVSVRIELARLSGPQRDALELRVVDELTYAEVARRLGVSEQAARARVSRGLRALAAALDSNRPGEETLA